MKTWLAALALVFLTTGALAYQSTVNPLLPVQNSPLQSSVVRGNFQATYNDINNIYSLIPGAIGTVTTVSCTVTSPATCSVASPGSSAQVNIVLPYRGNGTAIQLALGTTTSGHCAGFDGSSNLIDIGTCGGGGGGAVSSVSGTSGQITVSPTTGATIVSLPATLTPNLTFSGTANFTNTFSISGTAETFPASGLIVGTTDAQTLTNKSIAGSEINSGTVAATFLPTASSAAFGVSECDNVTITCPGGVFSAVAGGGGNVVGPLSSTTSGIATYGNTSGTSIVNNSAVTIVNSVLIDTQSISATSTDGFALQNTTSATVGAQKWSPRLRWTGDGWKTTSTAAGQLVDAIAELQPVQGSTNPSFNWVLSGQINAGGYTALVTVPSGGGFNLNSGTYQIGGTQVACANLSNGATGCSTTVGTAATQNTGTSGATLPFLNGTNTWSGVQSFNSGDVALKGATSGTITLNAAATAGSNTLTLPAGTTDFSGTGGTSQVVKQTSSGGAFTVARLACADLSNSSASCSTDATVATNITSGTLPTAQLPANQTIRALTFIIDGGGSTITTGVKGFILVPFACTINSATLLGDQSGSIVVDVWKKAFAASLPTVANTITASALPTISSNVTVQDTTLTGWTTSVSANDMIGFNVNSVTTMQRVTVILKCTAT